jgi:hypothetical protein
MLGLAGPAGRLELINIVNVGHERGVDRQNCLRVKLNIVINLAILPP